MGDRGRPFLEMEAWCSLFFQCCFSNSHVEQNDDSESKNLNRLLVASAAWKVIHCSQLHVIFLFITLFFILEKKFTTLLYLVQPWLQKPLHKCKGLSVILLKVGLPTPWPALCWMPLSHDHHLVFSPSSSHSEPPRFTPLLPRSTQGPIDNSGVRCGAESLPHVLPPLLKPTARSVAVSLPAGTRSHSALIVKREGQWTEKHTRTARLCVRDTLPCTQTDRETHAQLVSWKADSITYHQLQSPTATPTYPRKSLQKSAFWKCARAACLHRGVEICELWCLMHSLKKRTSSLKP